MSTIEEARAVVRQMAEEAGLLDTDVTVLARPLTPEEAIGQPGSPARRSVKSLDWRVCACAATNHLCSSIQRHIVTKHGP